MTDAGQSARFGNPRIRAQAVDWLLFRDGNACARCGYALPPDPHDPLQVRVLRKKPGICLFADLELAHVDCQGAQAGARAPEASQMGFDLK